MSTRDDRKHGNKLLTRRDILTRPFAWLAPEPSASWPDGVVPGRIPLNTLKYIPEAVLMRMVPIVRQGWDARVCDDGIVYRDDSGQEGIVPLRPEGCAAARLFDGIRTLEQVAAALNAELGISPSRGASIAREAFLTLAMREVFHPNDPAGCLCLPSTAEG